VLFCLGLVVALDLQTVHHGLIPARVPKGAGAQGNTCATGRGHEAAWMQGVRTSTRSAIRRQNVQADVLALVLYPRHDALQQQRRASCKLQPQARDPAHNEQRPGADPAVRVQMSSDLAAAWQQLSSLIIQEFIYDTFWGRLSPDTRFPAETRYLLNDAFAALLQRGRRLSTHHVSCHVLDSVAVRAALCCTM
jgi:hypothetical protein